jgi:hypothetical protein
MSDRELVTIDSAQFAALESRLNAIATRIGPSQADFNLNQVLTHIGRTLFDGFKLLAQAGGGDNSQVLNAIDNLGRKVDEAVMALKDDVQTLQGKFDAMETAVTAVAEDIAALKNELKEANERANIDLTPLITRAENIEAGLRASVGAQPGSDPAPAPEPAPEG